MGGHDEKLKNFGKSKKKISDLYVKFSKTPIKRVKNFINPYLGPPSTGYGLQDTKAIATISQRIELVLSIVLGNETFP